MHYILSLYTFSFVWALYGLSSVHDLGPKFKNGCQASAIYVLDVHSIEKRHIQLNERSDNISFCVQQK